MSPQDRRNGPTASFERNGLGFDPGEPEELGCTELGNSSEPGVTVEHDQIFFLGGFNGFVQALVRALAGTVKIMGSLVMPTRNSKSSCLYPRFFWERGIRKKCARSDQECIPICQGTHVFRGSHDSAGAGPVDHHHWLGNIFGCQLSEGANEQVAGISRGPWADRGDWLLRECRRGRNGPPSRGPDDSRGQKTQST